MQGARESFRARAATNAVRPCRYSVDPEVTRWDTNLTRRHISSSKTFTSSGGFGQLRRSRGLSGERDSFLLVDCARAASGAVLSEAGGRQRNEMKIHMQAETAEQWMSVVGRRVERPFYWLSS
jgi:hypothetical protein